MTKLTLRPRDRERLEELVSCAHDARLLRRAYGLLWLAAGESPDVIATQLGVSRQSVYNWLDRFRARQGLPLEARLADGERRGRPCTAQGVIDPWIEAIIEADPREWGYHSTIWTAPLLVSYLQRQHRLAVSCQSVRLAIVRLRLRWKRPRHQLALRPDTWQQAKGG